MDQKTQNRFRPIIEKLLAEFPTRDGFDYGRGGTAMPIMAVDPALVHRRQQLRLALERIDAGCFGRCIRCGHNLPLDRLQKDPALLACGDCGPRRR